MSLTDVPAPGGLTFPDGGCPELYAELLRSAHSTGRCPVWCGGTRRIGDMPVPPDVRARIDAIRPVDVVCRWWPGPCPEGCTCLAPFTGGFPGLVRAGSVDRSTGRATLAAATAFGKDRCGSTTLALADAVRPADVPAVVGWSGTCNYAERGDLLGLGAVLRSWEERFGATLVRIDDSTLLVAVADPPTTQAESEHVAAEHFAFCPDKVDPQTGAGPLHHPFLRADDPRRPVVALLVGLSACPRGPPGPGRAPALLSICSSQQQNAGMSASIMVRDVPDEVRDELAARAARSGRSLQEYLRRELIELAGRPSSETLRARVRARKEVAASFLSAEDILAGRDADRR